MARYGAYIGSADFTHIFIDVPPFISICHGMLIVKLGFRVKATTYFLVILIEYNV